MRYLVASVLACVAIVAGWFFVSSTERFFRQRTQAATDEAMGKGEITQQQHDDILAGRGDFGLELTPSEMRRMQIADLMSSLWFVFVPLAFLLCLGTAYLTRPAADNQMSVEQTPTRR